MSILNNNNQTIPSVPVAEVIANNIKNQARSSFSMMAEAFNRGSQTFWKNPSASPAEIAAALGTDAKEVFELHAKLGALLASVKPESINVGSSVVGEFTINEDGTVTITS